MNPGSQAFIQVALLKAFGYIMLANTVDCGILQTAVE